MRKFLLLSVVLAAGCSKPEAPKPSQAEADVAACKAAIVATLIDPESVQFSEVGPVDAQAGERGYVLTFNAKNRMGGYAGRQPRGCWVDAATGRVKALT